MFLDRLFSPKMGLARRVLLIKMNEKKNHACMIFSLRAFLVSRGYAHARGLARMRITRKE
jgi:hypothetical protein